MRDVARLATVTQDVQNTRGQPLMGSVMAVVAASSSVSQWDNLGKASV